MRETNRVLGAVKLVRPSSLAYVSRPVAISAKGPLELLRCAALRENIYTDLNLIGGCETVLQSVVTWLL